MGKDKNKDKSTECKFSVSDSSSTCEIYKARQLGVCTKRDTGIKPGQVGFDALESNSVSKIVLGLRAPRCTEVCGKCKTSGKGCDKECKGCRCNDSARRIREGDVIRLSRCLDSAKDRDCGESALSCAGTKGKADCRKRFSENLDYIVQSIEPAKHCETVCLGVSPYQSDTGAIAPNALIPDGAAYLLMVFGPIEQQVCLPSFRLRVVTTSDLNSIIPEPGEIVVNNVLETIQVPFCQVAVSNVSCEGIDVTCCNASLQIDDILRLVDPTGATGNFRDLCLTDDLTPQASFKGDGFYTFFTKSISGAPFEFAAEKVCAVNLGPVSVGPQGPQGPTGAQGAQGTDGAPGTDGVTGADGAPGTDGAPGADGAPGTDGAPGADGAPGVTGPQGARGATGVPGNNGVTGPIGATGVQGATGPQGPPGRPGVGGTGAGVCSPSWSFEFFPESIQDLPSTGQLFATQFSGSPENSLSLFFNPISCEGIDATCCLNSYKVGDRMRIFNAIPLGSTGGCVVVTVLFKQEIDGILLIETRIESGEMLDMGAKVCILSEPSPCRDSCPRYRLIVGPTGFNNTSTSAGSINIKVPINRSECYQDTITDQLCNADWSFGVDVDPSPDVNIDFTIIIAGDTTVLSRSYGLTAGSTGLSLDFPNVPPSPGGYDITFKNFTQEPGNTGPQVCVFGRSTFTGNFNPNDGELVVNSNSGKLCDITCLSVHRKSCNLYDTEPLLSNLFPGDIIEIAQSPDLGQISGGTTGLSAQYQIVSINNEEESVARKFGVQFVCSSSSDATAELLFFGEKVTFKRIVTPVTECKPLHLLRKNRFSEGSKPQVLDRFIIGNCPPNRTCPLIINLARDTTCRYYTLVVELSIAETGGTSEIVFRTTGPDTPTTVPIQVTAGDEPIRVQIGVPGLLKEDNFVLFQINNAVSDGGVETNYLKITIIPELLQIPKAGELVLPAAVQTLSDTSCFNLHKISCNKLQIDSCLQNLQIGDLLILSFSPDGLPEERGLFFLQAINEFSVHWELDVLFLSGTSGTLFESPKTKFCLSVAPDQAGLKAVELDNTVGKIDFAPGDLVALTENTSMGQPTRVHNLLYEAWQWNARIEDKEDTLERPSIDVDQCGNVYVVSRSSNRTTDPLESRVYNKGSSSLSAETVFGGDSVYGRLGGDGNWDWIGKITGNGVNISGTSSRTPVASDDCGGIYIAGSWDTTNSLNVEGGGSSLDLGYFPSVTSQAIFITYVDAETGRPRWIAAADSGAADLEPSIATDGCGNCLLAFHGSSGQTGVNFIDRDGFNRVSQSIPPLGSGYVTVAKINNGGRWQWAVRADSRVPDGDVDIAVDPCGDAYVVFVQDLNSSNNTPGFAPMSLYDRDGVVRQNYPSAGVTDDRRLHVAKISGSGFWQWIARVRGIGPFNRRAPVITADACKNIYLAYETNPQGISPNNQFENAGDMFASPIQTPRPGQQQQQLVIAKISSDGIWCWHSLLGAVTGVPDITTDPCGYVYVTTLLSSENLTLTDSNGDTGPNAVRVDGIVPRYFLGKIGPRGDWIWDSVLLGPNELDPKFSPSLVSDCWSNVYLAGSASGSPIFFNRDNATQFSGQPNAIGNNQIVIGKMANEPNEVKSIGVLQTVNGSKGTVRFLGNVPILGTSFILSGNEYYIQGFGGQNLNTSLSRDRCDLYGCERRSVGTACADNVIIWNPCDPLCRLPDRRTCESTAQSEIQHIRVTKTSTQNISDGTSTTITNWDQFISTFGVLSSHFNLSTGIFTAPRPGIYAFKSFIRYSGINAVGSRSIGIQIGGEVEYTHNALSDPNNFLTNASDCTIRFMNRGETAEVKVQHSAGMVLTANRANLEINLINP